ncbi:MAG: hypothetical protein NTX31_16995 [Burkholderiales bacterium]|nr:hypothetical protein [Burkholderiales bacterium]
MKSSNRYVYSFEEGDGKNRLLLGGKGANLCEMTQIGLNVPPGFTITTDACNAYLEKNQLPAGLMDEIRSYMTALEKKTGKGFGDGKNPLLISVRSGSAMSMPGMMDTILNLGLNDVSLTLPMTLTVALSSCLARSHSILATNILTIAWTPSSASTARTRMWI